MKKLPLALGALAISTVSVAGVASPVGAFTANTTGPDAWFVITRVNPRDNQLTIINKKFDTNATRATLKIYGLGADRSNEAAHDAVVSTGTGVLQEGLRIFDGYTHEMGLVSGVEQTLGADVLEGNLAENTSGVLYYVARVGGVGYPVGKVDYSRCIDSDGYAAAVAAAGEGDVVECRIEADETGSGYHYQPYLNEERVEYEVKAEPGPEPEPEPGDGGGGVTDGEAGKETGANGDADANAVKNTETGVEQGNGSSNGSAAGNARYATYTTYATVTSGEGSAYQNSDTTSGGTGAAEEYTTNADVWAVDESKVWDEEVTGVETPELGEDEDCGHFWPLVIGYVLAVVGWGILSVLMIKRVLSK